MNNTFNIQEAAKEWLDNQFCDEDIMAELVKRGYDERGLAEMMKEIKKLRDARKTSGGLLFILVGAVSCLLSCLLALAGGYSGGSLQMLLYGLTTLGILIVFVGLIKVFN